MHSITGECRKTWDPFPTCLYGECNNNSLCVCDEGYIHDHLVGRYDNCGLSVLGLHVYSGITLVALILSTSFSLFVASRRSGPKTVSREIALTSAASTACIAMFLIIILSSGPAYVTPWYAALLICFAITFFARLAGLIVVASIRPIAKFSRRAPNAKKFEIFLLRVVPSSLWLATVLSMSIGHGIGSDESVSTAIGVAYLCISITAWCEAPIIWYFMGVLLANLKDTLELDRVRQEHPPERKASDSSLSVTVDEARSGSITNNMEMPSKKNTTQVDPEFKKRIIDDISRFRARLAFLRFTATILALGMAVLGLIIAMIQLVVRTVPLSYLAFLTILLVLALLCAYITTHAKKRDKRTTQAAQMAMAHRPHRILEESVLRSGSSDHHRSEFEFSEGPKLRTIIEASEHSRWSQE